MKDKIIGRPIKLNRQKLIPRQGKDYASVAFIGDVHLGSPQCDVPRFQKMLDYCNKNNIYVFLMGDLIELATKHSVGAGWSEQEFNGQTQHEQMVEMLRPLAKKKLIIGSLRGNHEIRAYNEAGVDIAKALCRELDIPYLGDAGWSMFDVGKEHYHVRMLHGRSGSKFDGTALLSLERLAAPFHADMVAMGHAHKCIHSSVLMQIVLKGSVREHKKHLLITGHYLKYSGGYGETLGLPPSKLGSPIVKFMATEHDLFISW